MVRRYWRNLSLRTKALLVLAVPIVPGVISTAAIVSTVTRQRETQELVARRLEIKEHLAKTIRLSVGAENSVLEYLMTRQPDTLTPFRVVGEQWPATLQQLAGLVRDNPAQIAHLKSIASRRTDRPLVQLLEFARSSTANPPTELLESSRSQMETFRNELEQMQLVENNLLVEHVAALRRAHNQLLAVSFVGGGLGLIGGVLAAVAFTTSISRRVHRARDNAERLATGADQLPVEEAGGDEVGVLLHGIRDAHGLLKTREVELARRLSELTAVNDELEAFSYSVSHDLRAPLRHISGFVALLARSAAPKLDDEERRRFRTISESATRMGRLIDDLLAFSRMGRSALSRQLVSLDDMVRDVRKEAAAGDPRSERVVWSIQPLPVVEGDAALLRQVFVNLIGNALKYTRERPEPRIEIGVSGREPEQIVVFVRDNGVGFDMKYAHKLFGVFQRLHGVEEFEGTGIGLANVRRIVHRHGGRTWAEGALNGGATFYFSLPLAAQETTAA
jgi:signal transduction histidine kinase